MESPNCLICGAMTVLRDGRWYQCVHCYHIFQHFKVRWYKDGWHYGVVPPIKQGKDFWYSVERIDGVDYLLVQRDNGSLEYIPLKGIEHDVQPGRYQSNSLGFAPSNVNQVALPVTTGKA